MQELVRIVLLMLGEIMHADASARSTLQMGQVPLLPVSGGAAQVR
jgi:hypothetical protein